jgi:hypothetical protein
VDLRQSVRLYCTAAVDQLCPPLAVTETNGSDEIPPTTQSVLLVHETVGYANGRGFVGGVLNDVPESEVVAITRDPDDPCGEGPSLEEQAP